jgi:hypothetical protein
MLRHSRRSLTGGTTGTGGCGTKKGRARKRSRSDSAVQGILARTCSVNHCAGGHAPRGGFAAILRSPNLVDLDLSLCRLRVGVCRWFGDATGNFRVAGLLLFCAAAPGGFWTGRYAVSELVSARGSWTPRQPSPDRAAGYPRRELCRSGESRFRLFGLAIRCQDFRRKGNSAVCVDGYPDLVFPACFVSASPVAAPALGSPIKNFTPVFAIEKSDARLMPDLSVAVVVEPGVALWNRWRAVRHKLGFLSGLADRAHRGVENDSHQRLSADCLGRLASGGRDFRNLPGGEGVARQSFTLCATSKRRNPTFPLAAPTAERPPPSAGPSSRAGATVTCSCWPVSVSSWTSSEAPARPMLPEVPPSS